MLYIIKGDVGSGKTTHITELIREKIAAKKQCFLIVPEQQTVSYERLMTEKLPASHPLYLEITNFSRLANTVFRKYGGISYNYSSETARALIMWKTLIELLPRLHDNKSAVEFGRVKKMLSAISELRAASVSTKELEKAIQATKEERLKEKLEDLCLIISAYTANLKEHYSDQSEDLDRLYELLLKEDFFKEATVFVDSFTSFTVQEHKVLEAIMKRCDLYVTLPLPRETERVSSFKESESTWVQLTKRAGSYKQEILGDTVRTPSPLLRYVAKNITSSIAEQLKPYESEDEEKNGRLRIIECPDPYAEADFVAFDIKKKVQQGARYSDFSVFARSASDYEGILDTALKKYGIPCFMSVRSDISSFAPIKMICSAYSVISSNFQRRDLITYMKCSLTGIPDKDCDDFEIYTKKWNINGRRFIDGIDWNMNPRGYVDEKTDRHADFLIRINETRKALISPLEALHTRAQGVHAVKEHCEALFSFLKSVSLEDRLYEMAERAENDGEIQEAENYRRIFSVICDTLDLLYNSLPDTHLNAEEFSSLLSVVFAQTDIGQIPPQLDAVTVGSADMLRAESEHVYLFGVNANEFPAAVSDNGFFTQSDRKALSALNIEQLGVDLEEMASSENFYVIRAFSSAKSSVTLLHSRLSASYKPQKPSFVIANVKHLAGKFAETSEYDDINDAEKLWDRASAFEMIGKLSDGNEKDELLNILSEDSAYKEKLSTLQEPLTTKNAFLSKEVAERTFDDEMTTSNSKIESYASCAFSYFCKHVMSLEAHDDIKIDFLAIGNFVHSVLEKLFTHLEKNRKGLSDLNEEETKDLVSEITSSYVSRITPIGYEQTPRMKHLFSRLFSAVLLLVENLKGELENGEFKPRFFELEIGYDKKDSPSPITFTSKGGIKISLKGKIDRVDTYEKDNKVYVRVIDYKTGKKEFSLESLEYGKNMQMLIYLFSIWKTENEIFKKRLGCSDDGEIIPAGVLYTTASVDDASVDTLTEEEIEKAVSEKFKRSGLLLNDVSILRAMDRDFKYIPISAKNENELTPKKALASVSEMGDILKKIETVLGDFCDEMKLGKISASPSSPPKETSPCAYCNLRPICRQKAVAKPNFN